jgi:1,4-dihydroxy-2-naphthoate octaprenyltransferase
MRALPAPGSAGAWALAARPATLPAALAPVAVGTAVAAAEGRARPGVALLALATALLLQLAANLANDVFDFERGADDASRVGPPRAAQSGLISPRVLRRGLAAVLAAAGVSGLGLVAIGGWPIAAAGAAALVAAVAYTGGPWPLGWNGLGDACTFLFFGVVGVTGTHYVQAGAVSPLALVASVPVGFLVTAILVVNNARDLEGDRRAGKRTLAVRMGAHATRAYYAALVATAFVVPPALVLTGMASAAALLPLLALPWAAALVRTVATCTEAGALNAALVGTARLAAAHALLLAGGIAL